MKFYKDEKGEVYAYDQAQIDSGFVKEGLFAMTDQEVLDHLNPQHLPEPIPAEITMRQARLMLHRNGLLSGVQSTIDSLEEPQKTEAQIEWDYAQTVNRENPIMQLLAYALGLNDEALDEMFLEASKL